MISFKKKNQNIIYIFINKYSSIIIKKIRMIAKRLRNNGKLVGRKDVLKIICMFTEFVWKEER